jgi:hypothetical protein
VEIEPRIRKVRPITEVTSTALKKEGVWHVDPLLGSNREISGYTTAVAR